MLPLGPQPLSPRPFPSSPRRLGTTDTMSAASSCCYGLQALRMAYGLTPGRFTSHDAAGNCCVFACLVAVLYVSYGGRCWVQGMCAEESVCLLCSYAIKKKDELERVAKANR